MVNRITLISALCLLINVTANAETNKQTTTQDSATIRFYKINKHQQTSKIAVSRKKSSRKGCHNFRFSPRVLTLVQTGFGSCSVFVERNCPETALVKASHSKSDGFAHKLTQGHAWYIEKQTDEDTKGVRLRSWSCQ